MDPRKVTTDIALIGVFAALISAFAWTAVAVPGNPVPITLQTMGVALAALVLGPWRGFLATALYVLVGLAGLPVFAGGAAGISVLGKGSAGYLLSFPFAALLIGFAAKYAITWARRRQLNDGAVAGLLVACALLGSIVFVHPMGIAGLMRNAHLSFGKAFAMDMTFWIGDIIKSTVAGVVAVTVHKAFPALLGRRAEVSDDVAAYPNPATLR